MAMQTQAPAVAMPCSAPHRQSTMPTRYTSAYVGEVALLDELHRRGKRLKGACQRVRVFGAAQPRSYSCMARR